MSDKHVNQALRSGMAAFIADLLPRILPTIREVAHEHGYAVAVHGSLARDIDLIAVPWVDHADDADTLARAVCGAVKGVVGRCYLRTKELELDWTEKPHGRRAVSILIAHTHIWLDLSVTARLPKADASTGGAA